MISDELFREIRKTYGCAVREEAYDRIRTWEDWWRGEVPGFHSYLENAAFGHPIRRQLYSLRMAKKVCEDWAALLLNDRTCIRLGSKEAEKWAKAVFTSGDFFRRSNYLLEKAFALGTGACLIRVDGVPAGEWPGERTEPLPERMEMPLPFSEEIHGYTDTGSPVRIWFQFVDGGQIVPISVEGGRITEAAFVSHITRRGKEYEYLEVHVKERGTYVIHNRYFCREQGRFTEVDLPDMPARVIATGCPWPFFAMLSPNIQNPAEGFGGLGQSIYGDALDCLRGVDLAFNNFCRDLRLGGKKVFINQSLIRRDEAGNLYSPDDVAQQLFMTVGDTELSESALIEEHNPSLRTDENRDAVQAQLDYLSFRCGLGTGHYLFTDSRAQTKMTATQYTGERQDLRQNCAKHAQSVTAYLIAVLRPMVWLARQLLGMDWPAAEMRVTLDDSYFIDTESERSRDLREVEAGLMDPDIFRRRWYDGEYVRDETNGKEGSIR